MPLKLPPRYANVEMAALLGDISDGAFREYARLRAIAWGKDVVEFWLSEYAALFGVGVSEATLYRRLSELRKNAGLRFSSTRNSITGDRLFRVSFSILRIENALIASTTNTDESINLHEGKVVVPILNSENGEWGADWPFGEPPPREAVTIKLDQVYARILRQITGWPTPPGGATRWQDIAPVVAAYYARAGQDEEQAVKDLQPFWEAWLARQYSRTGTAWLTDWAASGVVPDKPGRTSGRNGNGNYAAMEEWAKSKEAESYAG